MTGEQVPFYSMFPFLEENEVLKELLSGAMVRSVNVDRSARRMEVYASSTKMAAPVELHLIEAALQEEFSLSGAEVHMEYTGAPRAVKAKEKGPEATVLMGRPIKKSIVPISSLTMESGRVAVEGEVFAVASREDRKSVM